jgi:hypothetical protein
MIDGGTNALIAIVPAAWSVVLGEKALCAPPPLCNSAAQTEKFPDHNTCLPVHKRWNYQGWTLFLRWAVLFPDVAMLDRADINQPLGILVTRKSADEVPHPPKRKIDWKQVLELVISQWEVLNRLSCAVGLKTSFPISISSFRCSPSWSPPYNRLWS